VGEIRVYDDIVFMHYSVLNKYLNGLAYGNTLKSKNIKMSLLHSKA